MTPLMLAVYFAQVDSSKESKLKYEKTIRNLLAAPFSCGTVDDCDGLQRTALHWAAIRGFGKAIKELLEKGASKKSVDVYGFTPLHYAIELDLNLGGGFDFLNLLIDPEVVNIRTSSDSKLYDDSSLMSRIL